MKLFDKIAPSREGLLGNALQDKASLCVHLMATISPSSPEFQVIKSVFDLTRSMMSSAIPVGSKESEEHIANYNAQLERMSANCDSKKLEELSASLDAMTAEFNSDPKRCINESRSPFDWMNSSTSSNIWQRKINLYGNLYENMPAGDAKVLLAMLMKYTKEARGEFAQVLNANLDLNNRCWDFKGYDFPIQQNPMDVWMKVASADRRFMDSYPPLANLPESVKALDKQLDSMIKDMMNEIFKGNYNPKTSWQDIVNFFTTQLEMVSRTPEVAKAANDYLSSGPQEFAADGRDEM